MAAIVAPAGVGKSRLVAELRQQTGADAFLWLEGRSQALTASTGYWLFTDMVSDYLTREAGTEVTADALIDLLQHLRHGEHLSDADVDEMGPLLGRLLSLCFDSVWDEWMSDVDAEQLRRRTLLALNRLIRALAEMQPLALICEDLHWADPLSLDLIGALMETLTSVPMLVIAVYRPEETRADGQLMALARRRCPDSLVELKLQTLNEAQSRQLMASLLAIDVLPAAMRNLITDKAQGNPLFLEEIVRTLIDGVVLYRDDARWRARRSLASVIVPASLQSVVLSRVDRLEPAEKTYLQAAAVLGRLFRPRLVDAMNDSAVAQAGTLAALEQESLVHRERSQPEPEYSFHHVLVRDAIYQDLWLNNFAAPKLMRPVGGDFAMEVICSAADADHPPLGGLLLWQNRQNYLRLTWNTLSPGGIELLGCVDNVDELFGIGRLPGVRQVHLRLERIGSRVRSLCSADGDIWYSAGTVDFPADDPAGSPVGESVQVGPLAIGMIHRYVHAGAWPEGSAIRFEALRIRQTETAGVAVTAKPC